MPSSEMTGHPAEVRYGNDITVRDVERLEAFLTGRTERLYQSDRGSDERKAARAIRESLRHHTVTLRHCFSFPEEEAGPQELVRWKVILSWNSLCTLTNPWSGDPQYDRGRWRSVKSWTAPSRADHS